MERKLLSYMVALTLIFSVPATPAAFAVPAVAFPDTQCFEVTAFCDIKTILDPDPIKALLISLLFPQCLDVAKGTPACDAALSPNNSFESIDQVFKVEPEIGAVVEDEAKIKFTLAVDGGLFLFTFGFCHADSVGTIDPDSQKQAWAVACLKDPRTVLIFDDTFDNVGAMKTVTIDVGSNLIFWIIPFNDPATFLANPSAFYVGPQPFDGPFGDQTLRPPLFSFELANPEKFDQWLSFSGSISPAPEKTLFTVEDKQISGGDTDEDFDDLGFLIDATFTDVPICVQFPMLPECIGGELLSIDNTALLVAGVTSPIAWYMYALTALGIGAFWFARNPYNVRNVKTIMGDYLDRFRKTD